VRQCTHVKTKEIRAVKSIDKTTMCQEDIHNFHTEILALKKLDHPNILKLYEIFQDEIRFHVVTEKIEGIELFDLIVEKQHFSEK
jgi:serine/threonine protein kinase